MNTQGIVDALVSHALVTGQFERVNGHEPKSAPRSGVSYALWVDVIEPIRDSGLASTSGRVAFMGRIYMNMTQEPQDGIDPQIIIATDAMMTEYSGDFELGGNLSVREIDLLGAYGPPLYAKAGYLEQDKRLMRVMTITIPVIVNDIWSQAA